MSDIVRTAFSDLRDAVIKARNGDENDVNVKATQIMLCEIKFGKQCTDRLLESIDALYPPTASQ